MPFPYLLNVRLLAAVNIFSFKFFAVFAFVVLVAYLMSYFYEKERRGGFEVVASGLDFIYTVSPRCDVTVHLWDFDFFNQGSGQVVSNLLEGERHNALWRVFDYRYVSGYGKDSHEYKQTVMYIRFKEDVFPKFSLRPRAYIQKERSYITPEVSFESSPFFRRRYAVLSLQDSQMRKVFSLSTIRFFEQMHEDMFIDAERDEVLVYQLGVVLNPLDVPDAIDKTNGLLKRLIEYREFDTNQNNSYGRRF